jgi:AcrR family transcriptional regulator
LARTIAKDHDAKRGHILKTAAKVFAAKGVGSASMSQVAQACGISKATIYHYYDSKTGLLFDILDSYLSQLRDRVTSLPLAGLPPRDQLRHFVTELLLAYEGMDAEHQIQSQGLPLLPTPQQDILKRYQRDMVSTLGDILLLASPDAFSDDRRTLRAATMSVFGMTNWYYMWSPAADHTARRAYADVIARLVLDGCDGLAKTFQSEQQAQAEVLSSPARK